MKPEWKVDKVIVAVWMLHLGATCASDVSPYRDKLQMPQGKKPASPCTGIRLFHSLYGYGSEHHDSLCAMYRSSVAFYSGHSCRHKQVWSRDVHCSLDQNLDAQLFILQSVTGFNPNPHWCSCVSFVNFSHIITGSSGFRRC